MSSENGRIVGVDILRGITIGLMILGHSFIVYPVNVYKIPWCTGISYVIYTFHMELLFIIAGYVYKCVDYKKYVYSKVKRILIPYIIFGSVSVLFKAFGGNAVNGNIKAGDGVSSLIFQGGGYWFLYVIFFIYMIFPLIEKVCKNNISIIIIMLIFAISQLFADSNIFQVHNILKFMTYFLCGYLVRKVKFKYEIIWNHQILFCVITVLIWYISDKIFYAGFAMAEYIRAFAISALLAVIVVKNINFISRCKPVKQFLIDAGKYSLQLYLFNGYLLVAARIIICNILKIENTVIIVGFIWVTNCIGAVVLCKCVIAVIPIFRKICGIK